MKALLESLSGEQPMLSGDDVFRLGSDATIFLQSYPLKDRYTNIDFDVNLCVAQFVSAASKRDPGFLSQHLDAVSVL